MLPFSIIWIRVLFEMVTILMMLSFNYFPSHNAGMQGHLWTELVRTSDEMDAMIFPRLLAVAERSWHKASWEDVEDSSSRKARMNKDWTMFANTLGYRELKVLDRMGVAYHLTPPGAR